VHGPGQVIGELNLRSTRAAAYCHVVSARAKEDVVVCGLSAESFLEALTQVGGSETNSARIQ
jgi:CRP-like cAMP-binding protein